MINDGIVLSRWVVNKVLEIAQSCVDESRKGWFVNMQEFNDGIDCQHFGDKEIREALAYLEARTYIITLRGEDDHIIGISIVPPRYQCNFCRTWLDSRDDPEDHIDLCLRLQRKMERNRKLVG
jgi:hypothetical protein